VNKDMPANEPRFALPAKKKLTSNPAFWMAAAIALVALIAILITSSYSREQRQALNYSYTPIFVLAAALIVVAVVVIQKNKRKKSENVQAAKNAIKCQNCGAEIPGNAKFCGKCGTAFVPNRNICKNCGAEMPDNLKFCQECGKPLQQKNVCQNCNTEMPDGAVFCLYCGSRLGQSQTQAIPKTVRNDSAGSNNYNTPHTNELSVQSMGYWLKALRIIAAIMIIIGMPLFINYALIHNSNHALKHFIAFPGLGIAIASAIVIIISVLYDPKIFKSRSRKDFKGDVIEDTVIPLFFMGGLLFLKFRKHSRVSELGFFGLGVLIASVVFEIMNVLLKDRVIKKSIK